ncbi:hypothetical protein [Aliamphritea spongicola]|nr:hypothetical protein [Aliamphritea spongicola]
MDVRQLSPFISISPQITSADIGLAAAQDSARLSVTGQKMNLKISRTTGC